MTFLSVYAVNGEQPAEKRKPSAKGVQSNPPSFASSLATLNDDAYDIPKTLLNLKGHDDLTTTAHLAEDSSSIADTTVGSTTLLAKFIDGFNEMEKYKNGEPVLINGYTLSVPAVAAVARCNASVTLDDSPATREKVEKGRNFIDHKLNAGQSIYGLSTGFGGSADTRTSHHLALGSALLQHQQSGVLPSSLTPPPILPLSDPLSSLSMPEAWVRGAILVRINSFIRGYSGVRWELMEKMVDLLRENITPLVPLRGSISSSGDLIPLSYIAGTLVGNPSIRVFDGPSREGHREIVPSSKALAAHGLEPISLVSKEHLSILNGTAFSASVGSLALNDAVHLALLAQVCTAMGTEAMLGTQGSHAPFLHAVTRPHPGQVEAAATIFGLLEGSQLAQTQEKELSVAEDVGKLRQDRYALRTSPQFLGPQIEDILSALASVTQECNSTTDNPLIDPSTGDVHHGGNFQAMAVTNAMEKTRLALNHIGRLLFAQAIELVNPMFNRGLPPSLAATDPSINYHGKGLDICMAAYVSELGFLANPVSTHIQSAELHNQSVNSLALISARQTINGLEILSLLVSSYLYLLCQALDLRALQSELKTGIDSITREEIESKFGVHLTPVQVDALSSNILAAMHANLETTTTMDAVARFATAAATSTTPIVEFFTSHSVSADSIFVRIAEFRDQVASRSVDLLEQLRTEYLSGARGPAPASRFLDKTRGVYEFIRLALGIKMHGEVNQKMFKVDPGMEEISIGQNVSLIHEAIRDGKMQGVVAALFSTS
jgi:phenylalanine ammonia-lyase